MARKRVSRAKREKNKRISEKIEMLRRQEGKTAEEAAGEAYSMERSGRLGRRGVYHRVGARRRKRGGRRR